MSTFKSKLFSVCQEVVCEFSGWSFMSTGQFKTNLFKHTDFLIRPGFGFENGSTPLQPSIWISHKKSMSLFKKIVGYEQPTSIIKFQLVPQLLENIPDKFRNVSWIFEDKKRHLDQLHLARAPLSKESEEIMIDIAEAHIILREIIIGGINIIDKLYDRSSEKALLTGLPPNYVPRNGIYYDEMEKQKGVMLCIVRILLGDFNFVEKYRSNEFKTEYPKRFTDLDKIIAALPELKKRYAATGEVI